LNKKAHRLRWCASKNCEAILVGDHYAVTQFPNAQKGRNQIFGYAFVIESIVSLNREAVKYGLQPDLYE